MCRAFAGAETDGRYRAFNDSQNLAWRYDFWFEHITRKSWSALRAKKWHRLEQFFWFEKSAWIIGGPKRIKKELSFIVITHT